MIAGWQHQLNRRLHDLHAEARQRYPALRRIAVAAYDPDSDRVKTFLESTVDGSPLNHYDAVLNEVPSLAQIAATGRPRIIDALEQPRDAGPEHTRKIYGSGARSSYTVPILGNRTLFGFLFFNAWERSFFTPRVIKDLELYAEVVSLLVISEIMPIRTMGAAIRTAREFGRQRDEETGAHLERMARYARVIAKELAADYGLTDEFVELIFQLSSLHDLGKIAVPDHILLKPGRLSPEEYAEMQEHVDKGAQIVDVMVQEFGLDSMQYAAMLRNIVACHHEAVDGSGYPRGLRGGEIPLEARISAVADVFDALTSPRPYKKPWSNEEAFGLLLREAGKKFDADCVRALVHNRTAVEEIQARFRDRAAPDRRPAATP